ncbi:aminoglycoside phosphotransferase family protein [Cellulomonas sp. ATA003]|uniref:aminoglycoside phosphotransferase family protein n=1 Tax=Cellulomonas sp. ATA003 TaxID=3073064 RepID=UPI002873A86A|nr:aminoglycoside phosphotransferase family protein [Cellulomonas sp. ATA003]WNB84426.1 aminoglycoside phosphotransferase family protein [Cellulomonas sp. ATA003]
MATRPAAEVDVTPALVRALLREQHPDLADRPLAVAASGWDTVVLRLGDDLAVRVPRRASADALVRHEQRWLPGLAARLPAPVPVPVRVGRPSPAFAWSWSVVPWFTGRLGGLVPRAGRSALAGPLAAVVAALHTPAPGDAPHNPVRGVPLSTRDRAVRERLATGAVPDADRVLARWRDALDVPPWSGPPLWLHGDLHPVNLLVAPDGGLAAVLDWGDVTAGDPATDLATAWLTFDAAGRRAFRAGVTAASGPDDATWARARGWALCMASAMLAHSDDDPVMRAVGRAAMAQVLAD